MLGSNSLLNFLCHCAIQLYSVFTPVYSVHERLGWVSLSGGIFEFLIILLTFCCMYVCIQCVCFISVFGKVERGQKESA